MGLFDPIKRKWTFGAPGDQTIPEVQGAIPPEAADALTENAPPVDPAMNGVQGAMRSAAPALSPATADPYGEDWINSLIEKTRGTLESGPPVESNMQQFYPKPSILNTLKTAGLLAIPGGIGAIYLSDQRRRQKAQMADMAAADKAHKDEYDRQAMLLSKLVEQKASIDKFHQEFMQKKLMFMQAGSTDVEATQLALLGKIPEALDNKPVRLKLVDPAKPEGFSIIPAMFNVRMQGYEHPGINGGPDFTKIGDQNLLDVLPQTPATPPNEQEVNNQRVFAGYNVQVLKREANAPLSQNEQYKAQMWDHENKQKDPAGNNKRELADLLTVPVGKRTPEQAQRIVAIRQAEAPQLPAGYDRTQSEQSYNRHLDRIDKLEKPIDELAGRFSRLQAAILAKSPQADSLIGPELLTVMAGGQGSGIRMSEAELTRIFHARSNLESIKAALNKFQSDPTKALSITDAQRAQIKSLVDAVYGKIQKKQRALQDANDKLIGTDDIDQHKRIYAGLKKSLNDVDMNDADAPILQDHSDIGKRAK